MKTPTVPGTLNRRAAVAGLGASGLGLALLAQPNRAAADHMSREERALTALRMGGGQSGFADTGPIDYPAPNAPASGPRIGPIE